MGESGQVLILIQSYESGLGRIPSFDDGPKHSQKCLLVQKRQLPEKPTSLFLSELEDPTLLIKF